MKVAFPKRRRLSFRRNEPRLWPFGAALAAGFATAIVGLIALTWLAWLLLHRPSPPHPGAISLHDTVSVIQLVFASVAGSGALVALIVAYRKQKIAEADSAHDRTRVFNERFATIATQLGDESPAVRLAAVHAMAGLADDWEANRQTCIDVLCAYLRMPYEPDPGEGASATERLTFQSNREVRHTVIRIISSHLQDGASVSWQRRNFDFTGVIFDGGDFSRTEFSGSTLNFNHAEFTGGTVDFIDAKFTRSTVDFSAAYITGGTVDFKGAEFTGSTINFTNAKVTGGTVDFIDAKFTGSEFFFPFAVISGGTINFLGGKFAEDTFHFGGTTFTGGKVDFHKAMLSSSTLNFGPEQLPSDSVRSIGPRFSGSTSLFDVAVIFGGTIQPSGAKFSGGVVDFKSAEFTDSSIDLRHVSDWSRPPRFDEPMPSSVKLPAGSDQPDTEG